MATATLTYTAPLSFASQAAQQTQFMTNDIYTATDGELLGLPQPPTSDTFSVVGGNVQRVIKYDLTAPGLATFVSRFPTLDAQTTALKNLFTSLLEALVGCKVSENLVIA